MIWTTRKKRGVNRMAIALVVALAIFGGIAASTTNTHAAIKWGEGDGSTAQMQGGGSEHGRDNDPGKGRVQGPFTQRGAFNAKSRGSFH